MKRLASLLSCVIVMIFLMVGCATLWELTQTHYKTFELTIDKQKVVVNLPNELPSMEKAASAGESCFNTDVCRQRFCVTEDLGHDHVDFVYIKTDVVALVWIKTAETEFNKRFVAWVYIDKKPISAPITKIQDLIKERETKNQ